MKNNLKIIAEFCQNHNGDFDILKRMIDAASRAGATHGKIQTIFARDVSFRPEFEEGKTGANGQVEIIKRPYQPEYDRLKGLELSYEQQREFIDECKQAGLIPLTTAFNLTCIPAIAELDWKVVKVASYDCGSLPLLQALTESFDELIVSTGASTNEEITGAAKLLRASGKKYSLLHCVTIYPTPLEQMHLARMDWLKNYTDHVGLSDHSLVARDGVKAALAAIYLGAEIIERHFTILPEEGSRDGRVSIRAEHIVKIKEFAALSKDAQLEYLSSEIADWKIMLGQEDRELSHEELLNRAYYRGRFSNKIGEKQIFNWQPEATQAMQEIARERQKNAA